MVQSPANRLLTEAAAAAAYRTAAQVDTQANARIAALAVPLTAVGAASGVAALGADGKIVPSQLGGSSSLVVAKPTATSRASVTGQTEDPHLFLTGIAAGTYWLTAGLLVTMASSSVYCTVGFLTNLSTPSTVGSIGTVNGAGSSNVSAATLNTAGINIGSGVASAPWMTSFAGAVVLPAGRFSIRWAQSVSNAANVTLEAGSFLRLEKLA